VCRSSDQEQAPLIGSRNRKGALREVTEKTVIRTPPGARFSCLGCGRCCTHWNVIITGEEYERFRQVDWASVSPSLGGKELFIRLPERDPPDYVIGQDPVTGRCLFLDEENRCVMHAHLGGEKKGLTCRLFPLMFVEAPDGVTVGLRFNCPAVQGNSGEDLSADPPALGSLLEEVRNSQQAVRLLDPIPFDSEETLSWDLYLQIENTLNDILRDDAVSAFEGLVRGAFFLEDILEPIEDGRFGEIARSAAVHRNRLSDSAAKALEPPEAKLGFKERLFLNHFLGYFVKIRKAGERPAGAFRRFCGFLSDGSRVLAHCFHRGTLRPQGFESAVSLRAVEEIPPVRLSPDMEALMRRYFAYRVFSRTYFGRAFFHFSLKSGFNLLLIIYALILYLARAHAAMKGNREVTCEDLREGLACVEYSYLSSTVLAGKGGRWIQILTEGPRLPVRLVHSQQQP
jgi:Fe-S-cluster containining protein